MFENELFNYGMAGIFIAYLIYNEYIREKKQTEEMQAQRKAIENNTSALINLINYLKTVNLKSKRNLNEQY